MDDQSVILLIVAVAVVLLLWPLWLVLTHKPKRRIRIKRVWSWRRVMIRTLDGMVLDASSGSKLVVLVSFAPLILYMVLAPVLGIGWTLTGMVVSGGVCLILLGLFAWRAWKWMRRTLRSSRDWLRQHRTDGTKPSRAARQSLPFKFGRELARFTRPD